VRGSQYRSAIWYSDEDQLVVINATKEPLEDRFRQKVTTAVLPLETFYNAEDYHQKYSLQRHHNLMDGFRAIYPEFQGVVDSTAAARLNGFASGYGTPELFEEEKGDYGFSADDLRKAFRR
jgi:peptide-methionine (S)-S-oxide reductase